jgi:tetratricopeptide (TPR) repeat protein/tRNA A-37 threonylcarbamoyl transferase component Bud32
MPDERSTAAVIDEIVEEYTARLRAGERPSPQEYAARFPELADEIRTAIEMVGVLDRLKPRPAEASEAPARTQVTGPAEPPAQLGDYHIVREIGRGGMGVVYEAYEQGLGRPVAVKVLAAHLLPDPKSQARFRREARAAARLHHSNIVPVFAVGEQDGQCYYVMQRIDGEPLDRLLQKTAAIREGAATAVALPPAAADVAGPRRYRAAARFALQAAGALAYAHSRGVLHRDVKPSNLLLDEAGTVWVTDFGLAKIVEATQVTHSGDLLGTLKYMPPESFAGRSDERGDVYGLGVTLYELLTLRPAFPETTPEHLIRLITHQAPAAPRKLNRDIPRDLETIVLKATARDPDARYQDCDELAEDLERFLADRPVLARRTGPVAQLARWCRRNPALAAVTAAALALMVAVTVVSLVAYAQTAAANREMQKALAAEREQRDRAELTAALALEALNRTYDRLGPSRLVVAPPAAQDAGVDLPPQPAALPPAAAELLEDLLQNYERIATAAADFPRLRPQVAEAYHRIGDLRRRLGRLDAAAAAYRTAIDLYQQQLAGSERPELRVPLARACNELGRTYRALGRYDDAARLHETAVAMLREAPPAFADRPECRFELACSYYALGERDMFRLPGGPGGPGDPKGGKGGPPKDRPPGADDNHPTRRALVLLTRLVDEFPAMPEYRHLLACCYRELPPGGPKGMPPGGSNTDKALELLRQLVADFPNVPDYRLDLCETLVRPDGPKGPKGPKGGKGEPKWDYPKGGDPLSRARLQEAIDLSAELVALYPSVPDYAAAHARYLDRLGMTLYDAGEYEAAERAAREAVALQGKLAGQYPGAVAYNLWLGLMERSLGRTLDARGELAEARQLLEAATARVEKLWKDDPRLEGVRPFLGMAYRDLARVLTRCGEPALAAAAQRKAEEFDGKGGPGKHGH